MPGIILTGSESLRDSYIQNIIQEHSIETYNQHVFTETFKISHARSVKQMLATMYTPAQSYVVAIKNGITIEAQNALLKLLEELEENVFMVFSVQQRDELLPTIVSRCKVVPYAFHDHSEIHETVVALTKDIVKALQENDQPLFIYTMLKLGEFVEGKDIHTFESVITSLRGYLHDIHTNTLLLLKIARLLDGLNSEYQFIVKNNGNKRIMIDYAGLSYYTV